MMKNIMYFQYENILKYLNVSKSYIIYTLILINKPFESDHLITNEVIKKMYFKAFILYTTQFGADVCLANGLKTEKQNQPLFYDESTKHFEIQYGKNEDELGVLSAIKQFNCMARDSFVC